MERQIAERKRAVLLLWESLTALPGHDNVDYDLGAGWVRYAHGGHVYLCAITTTEH
jgi:hypothetical protein